MKVTSLGRTETGLYIVARGPLSSLRPRARVLRSMVESMGVKDGVRLARARDALGMEGVEIRLTPPAFVAISAHGSRGRAQQVAKRY